MAEILVLRLNQNTLPVPGCQRVFSPPYGLLEHVSKHTLLPHTYTHSESTS